MPADYSAIAQDNIIRRGTQFDDIGRFIAEQLYSDRTHFIYELLQNAEDAGATRIAFRLYPDRLEVRHDGRPFDEADVRAVCDVLHGTKVDDAGKIGKFGIGFKSVYSFTSSPEIHSGAEQFCIERYIRPRAAKARRRGPGETLFVFPFDHPALPPDKGIELVGRRLQQLSPRTLLFLRHLTRLDWQIDDGASGTYEREGAADGSTPRVVSVIGLAG